ncbi:MAG: FtsX-like permease family protein, partial [Cyclobacteriaceae bacterium]
IKDKTLLIGSQPLQVVGLIKDFNYETLQVEVAPILHFHRTPANRTHQYISINSTEGNEDELIDFIKSKWTLISQTDELPFNYFFLSETIDQVYQSENRLFTMIKLFAFVIVIVACLGLYGLSSFTLEKKKKEIGIRKVLGASIPNIVTMFFRKYLTLLFISFIVAAPISWYLMKEWLSGYASHTTLSLTVFVLSFLSIVIIALAVISLKTIQVASMNPSAIIKEDS